jgi:hypothetical protein
MKMWEFQSGKLQSIKEITVHVEEYKPEYFEDDTQWFLSAEDTQLRPGEWVECSIGVDKEGKTIMGMFGKSEDKRVKLYDNYYLSIDAIENGFLLKVCQIGEYNTLSKYFSNLSDLCLFVEKNYK